METPAGTKKASAPLNKVIIAAAVVTIVLLTAIVVILLTRPSTTDEGSPKIGYSAEARVMLDQNSLQAAMDEAMENARNSYVGLRYKNNAFSTDGVNFQCFIVNSTSNTNSQLNSSIIHWRAVMLEIT